MKKIFNKRKVQFKRKAQLKMGETIAILFIFFILLIIGAVFYMNLQRTTVYRDIQQTYEMRAVELSQVISFLPELQCSESNVMKPSCFDLHKIEAFGEVATSKEGLFLYDREFGQVKIEILRIYPNGDSILLWDKEKPDFTSAPVTSIPIVLFDSVKNTQSFGVLQITVYN